MWSHMQIKHLATLEEMLHQHGIIVETQESRKVCLDVLRKFWLQNCVVIHLQSSERKPASTSCTCFHFRRRGHCPHVYFIRQHLRLETWLTPVLPRHEDVPRDLDSDGSSVRARSARPSRKSTKRKRPACYVPVPLPEAAVGEVLPERRSQRVLPPQRAARSRSRNAPRRSGQRR